MLELVFDFLYLSVANLHFSLSFLFTDPILNIIERFVFFPYVFRVQTIACVELSANVLFTTKRLHRRTR